MLPTSFQVPLLPLGIEVTIRQETFGCDLERAANILRRAWPGYAMATNLPLAIFEDDGNQHTKGHDYLPTELANTFVGGPIVILSSLMSLFQFRDCSAPMNPDVIGMFGGGAHNGEPVFETYRRESQEELNIEVGPEYAFPLYLEGCVIRQVPWLRVIVGTVLPQFPATMVVSEGYGPVLMPERTLLHPPAIVLPKSRADTLMLFKKLKAAA